VGDLHGAIAGISRQGFLGALYQHWPFPRDPAQFRQKAQGMAPREVVEAEASRFGHARRMEVTADPGRMIFSLDEFSFDQAGLVALADYVWRGGMPGWQRARRPAYLEQMAQAVIRKKSPWFRDFDPQPEQVGIRL
jgi:hypothetical protein